MRRELSLAGMSLVAYACALVLGSLMICVGAYKEKGPSSCDDGPMLVSDSHSAVHLLSLCVCRLPWSRKPGTLGAPVTSRTRVLFLSNTLSVAVSLTPGSPASVNTNSIRAPVLLFS